eukprot:396241_1
MGFDEDIAKDASNKHPKNKRNKALEFALKSQQNNNDKQPSTTNKPTVDNDEKKAENKNITNIYKSECDDILSCSSLNRLIGVLRFYKMKQNSNTQIAEEIKTYFMKNKENIICDYHHILNQHLNEDMYSKTKCDQQFKQIYDILMNNDLKCDINKCKIYKRCHREREKYSADTENKINVEMDFLDSIHAYFIHSVDSGFRNIVNKKKSPQNNSNKIKDNPYFDEELNNLQKLSRNKLINIRGNDRMKHNKFVTQITNDEEQKINNNFKAVDLIYDPDNKSNQNYSFGKRFSYHGKRAHYDFEGLTPKFSSLKEELTKNTICNIDMEMFSQAYQKAEYLISSSNNIKTIKCCNAIEYGLGNSDLLSLNHALSIIFYTDYDTLSFKFSTTFRKLRDSESDKDILSRNLQFGNWTKYLTETVNAFGTKVEDTLITVFYHGISFLYISTFITTFNCPTSTTTKLQIAYNFAERYNGIILELKKYDVNSDCYALRYFNCSLFSNFANEEERLFITPPRRSFMYLQTCGIRNIATGENYTEYVTCLYIFQQIIGGSIGLLSSVVSSKTMNLLNNLISFILDFVYIVKYPEYILTSLQQWRDAIKVIHINVSNVMKYAPSIHIFCDKIKHLLDMEILNRMFKNVEEIRCDYVGDIDEECLKFLLSNIKQINSLNHSKLSEIELCMINKLYSSDFWNKINTEIEDIGWKMEEEGDDYSFRSIKISRERMWK